MRLRPVTFRYRQPFAAAASLPSTASSQRKFRVMPSLAVFDEDGQPETVRYHELPVLLLNEVQRLGAR